MQFMKNQFIEEAISEIEENIYKPCISWVVNFQKSMVTQFNKKMTQLKMSKWSLGEMSQRHKCPKGCIRWKTPSCNNQVSKGLLPPGKRTTVKKCKNKVLVRMQRKGHFCTFLVGILVQ